MLTAINRANPRTRINFLVFCGFLAVALLFGGASRADVISLPLVRLASLLVIVSAALQMDRDQLRQIRLPLLFLAAVAAAIAIQLVPLPPDLWASLPGRERFAHALAVAGIPPIWRPASLTPDLTLNSLLSVLPPLAAVMGLATIDRSLHRLLVSLLLIAIALSALVGLLQVYGGRPYFYDITNEGSAVGFFSNRNHLALLIATALPLVACWAALPHHDPAYRRLRFWLFLCAAAAVLPILLIIGSRAGLLAAAAGVITIFGFTQSNRRPGTVSADRMRWLIPLIPIVIGVAAVSATLFFSRDVALQRLIGSETSELRSNNLPIYLTMIRDFFPVGSGFGSFDSIYRSYEPVSTLTQAYLNHAHNDFAEIMIESGVIGGLLALLFLVWFAVRSALLWFRKIESPSDLVGRAGSATVLLLLLGSVVDYPLRTPFMAVLVAVACCWMLPNPKRPRASERET